MVVQRGPNIYNWKEMYLIQPQQTNNLTKNIKR